MLCDYSTRKHNMLMELNSKVIGALQMYHDLMRELPGYGYSNVVKPGMPAMPQVQCN